MRGKAVSVMLILLFFGILPFVFDVQPVKASGTIYIRADGSIDPATANITTVDNITYTFTGNNYDEIVLERDNIIVDGNGYTLQGSGSGDGFGWSGIDNVTIRNATIRNFSYGIYVYSSSLNTISGNNLTNIRTHGITLENSDNNIIFGNNIAVIRLEGIVLTNSNNSIISDNNISVSQIGGACVLLYHSSNNTITGNYMDPIEFGYVVLFYQSSGNRVYHNFMRLTYVSNDDSVNVWDDGYPSGGNYWGGGADLYGGPYQNETGSDGINDTPYVIDANNADFYPLMSPYPSIHAIYIESVQLKTALAEGFSTKFDFKVASAHFTETFNVTAYANSTVFDTLTNVTVLSGNSATLTLTWNSTSLPKGNYNLSVHATPVPAELFTKDNTHTYWVLITIVGDVDGDRDVDVGDQRKVQNAMFTTPGDLNWNPNADIDCDEDVDVGDQRKQQLHMFESW